jgi:hypothetical protein
LLYRLYVQRKNVSIHVTLWSIGAMGEGTLPLAVPGRYEPFSVTVRTEKPISKVTSVILSLDEDTGTTSAMY